MTRNALDRARQRLDYARRELARFEVGMNDPDDASAQRTWRKLSEDVRQAEIDLNWAQHDLSDSALDAVFQRTAE